MGSWYSSKGFARAWMRRKLGLVKLFPEGWRFSRSSRGLVKGRSSDGGPSGKAGVVNWKLCSFDMLMIRGLLLAIFWGAFLLFVAALLSLNMLSL